MCVQGTREDDDEEDLPLVCTCRCYGFFRMQTSWNQVLQKTCAERLRDCACTQGTRRRAKRPKQTFQSVGSFDNDGGLEIEIEDWSEGQWIKQNDVRVSRVSESEAGTDTDTPVVRRRLIFFC